jgi:hypothetical protein
VFLKKFARFFPRAPRCRLQIPDRSLQRNCPGRKLSWQFLQAAEKKLDKIPINTAYFFALQSVVTWWIEKKISV